MGTGVAGQESEGQPAAIDVFWRGCDKTSHVVAPEGEAAESEGESATQVAQHADIVCGRIASPVQGIALRACPCGACPDDAFARILALYGLP